MNPFIQKKIGNITQQQRTGIVRQLQPCQDIVGRMMAVVLETFSQRADVYQIIRLKYDKGRSKYAGFVHCYIQQIDLGMLPQNPAGFRKLLINLRYIVADTQRCIGHCIYRQYI